VRVYHGAVGAELLPVIKGMVCGDGMVCPAARVVCSMELRPLGCLGMRDTDFVSLHDLGFADIGPFFSVSPSGGFIYTHWYTWNRHGNHMTLETVSLSSVL
jgi:hypothetical protein